MKIYRVKYYNGYTFNYCYVLASSEKNAIEFTNSRCVYVTDKTKTTAKLIKKRFTPRFVD